MVSQSPPPKRIKLESTPDPEDDSEAYKPEEPPIEDEMDEEHCAICLQPLSDRTVLPGCSHEFCFDCILIWTEQSRKCPLCSGQIGEYLIHNIRSKYDFRKHYLTPLRTSPRPDVPLVRAQATQRRRAREVEWGRNQRRERERERKAADELERAIEKRRWVYRHNLYAKHVASNSHTRHRPPPTPQQFSSNPDLVSRATVFIRRELRVWDALDIEFLTTFTVSLMKSLDIRSEPAVKLLAEFLDMDSDGLRTNAEHFAHELCSYLRSPYRDLNIYDSVVQYDTPEDLSPPRRHERSRRWATESPSPPPSRSPSPGPSHTRARIDLRHHARTVSPRARAHSRSRLPERSLSRGKHRSRTRSSSRPRTAHRGNKDPQTDKESARRRDGNGGGHVQDVKGKGRAVEVDRGREAGTYTRSRSNDGTDAVLPRGPGSIEGEGPGRINNEVPTGQSALAQENKIKASPPGAGIVGPSGLNDVPQPAAARNTAQEQARPNKEERPRVGRGAWQSLNTYLTGTSSEKRHTHDTRRRAQPETHKPEPVELSIRGAARQRVDSSTEIPSVQEPSKSTLHEDDSRPERTATGTPAMLARTPEDDVPHAADTGADVMARVRARLTKSKQEVQEQRGPEDPALSSLPQPKHGVPINTAFSTGPSTNSSHTLALIPISSISVATTAESPRASMETSPTSAGSAFRARLLDKLARERRGAHLHHQEETHRHDDRSHSGLGDDIDSGRAEGEDALDASAVAQTRRDAEVLEAKLRQQARSRVMGYKDSVLQDAAADDGLSGMATNETFVRTELRTREEALRAKLKRSR